MIEIETPMKTAYACWGRPTIPSLVRRNDEEAELRNREDDLSPGVGKFGEAMQKKDQRGLLLSSMQEVHVEIPDPGGGGFDTLWYVRPRQVHCSSSG